MNNLEIPKEKMSKLSDEEKTWCNLLFRYLYGKRDVRMRNRVLAWLIFAENNGLKRRLPAGLMRNVIHFIRNEIIPVNAGKIVYAMDIDKVPESYKTGTFWIDATTKGYKATKKTDDVDKHIETLISRRGKIDKDIESARLVRKALVRLEGEI